MKKLQKKIEKGMFISPQQIKEFCELDKTDPYYHLKLLQIKHDIENEHPEFTCKVEGDGVSILTDREACQYNKNWFARHHLGLNWRHDKYNRTDTSDFSKLEKQEYDRSNLIMSEIRQAANDAARRHIPKLQPSKRNINKMLRI